MKPTTKTVAEEGGFLKRILHQGAQELGISPRKLLWIWSIPVIAIALGIIAAGMGKKAYKLYTMEDGIAEIVQVFLYLTAFVYCWKVTRKLWQTEQKFIAALYGFVLIGLFFMIGEELSWGQRIFGWETSETLREINKQEETNLHNIYGVGSTFKWLQMLVGAYGTILPLLLLKVDFLKRNRFFSYVIPHYTLIPFFAPLFFWRIFRNFFDMSKAEFDQILDGLYFVVSEFNEVMELCFAAGILLFLVYQWQRLQQKQKLGAHG